MQQLLGIAWLCGIGFTMSLFIGSLAFEEAKADFATDVRVGILAGSLLSAIPGYLVLRDALANKASTQASARRRVWSAMGREVSAKSSA